MSNKIITPAESAISYFLSDAIKVYPCAFRGYNDANVPFDTEARARTEKNVVNKYSKLSAKIGSYVIDWKSDTEGYSVTFVLAGYYCEVSGLSTTDIELLATKKLIINTTSTNDAYNTLVLGNLYNSITPLSTLDNKIEGKYLFCGIGIVNTATTSGFTASLKIFEKEETDKYSSVSVSNWETGIDYYTKSENNEYSLIDKSETPTPISGEKYYIKSTKTKYYMNPGAATIFNSIKSGSGVHSLEMLVDDEDVSGNTSTISNSCTASGKNSVALGYNTIATKENEVTIGKYNENKDAAFLIGNGKADNNRTNQFEILKNGTVNVVNNINNILNLGGNTADLGTGSINVFGENENKVFEVTNTGKVSIADDSSISGQLKLSKDLSINTDKFTVNANNGDTMIAGNLDITGNLKTSMKIQTSSNIKADGTIESGGDGTIKGKLTVDNSTNLSDTLTVGKQLTVKSGGASIIGNVSINQGTLTSDNALTVNNGGANITGNTEIKSGTLTSNDKLTVNKNGMAITGNSDIIGKLTVSSDINSEGNLILRKTDESGDLYGAITAGRITANYNIIGLHDISLNGDGSIGGNLKVSGDSEITGSTKISKNLVVSGTTDSIICGDLYLGNTEENRKDLYCNAIKSKILTTQTPTSTDSRGEIILSAPTSVYKATISETLYVDGNTTLNSKLEVYGDTTLTGKLTTEDSVEFNGNLTGTNWSIKNGTMEAVSYNATSDARLKTNIKTFIPKKSILDLNIKSFEYINDKTHTTYIGCIAQELQEICPEVVQTNEDGYLSVQETKLVYLLLNEVKKLKAEVELLKRRK